MNVLSEERRRPSRVGGVPQKTAVPFGSGRAGSSLFERDVDKRVGPSPGLQTA